MVDLTKYPTCVVCLKDVDVKQQVAHDAHCVVCDAYTVWHDECVLPNAFSYRFNSSVCVNGCIPLPKPWGRSVAAQFTQAVWD